MKRKRNKEITTNILLLTGGIFIFFLLAEGVTRLIMPTSVKMRLMHQPDDRRGYRSVPYSEMRYQTSDFNVFIKINSEGLRDYEYKKEKDRNTFRILVLGDSFTFGIGVNMEETYPKVLESMLNGKSINGDRKYEVINAGIAGYGTEQEYLYLEELGKQYMPDLVVVGLTNNDINDVMSGIPSGFGKARPWIKKHFYFLSYLRALQISLIRLKYAKIGVFQIYQDQYTPEFKDALQKTKEYLVKIRDFSQSIGAKTFIVIIPSCFEIDKLEWDKKGFGYLHSDEFFNKNMARFSEIFTDFGKMNDISTLPLLPVFRKTNMRPLYFKSDPHWNREGHRLASESIYKFMKEEGLVS